MGALLSIVSAEVARELAGWQLGDEIDIGASMMRLSQRIAARALFGVELSDDDVERVGADLSVAADHFQSRIDSVPLLLLPVSLPTRAHRRLASARADLRAIVGRAVETRRGRPAGDDPLGAMIAAQRDHRWLTDELLRDETIMLLTESREDPALALTWAWYLLARNPGAQERLRSELDRVLGGREPGPADLPALATAERLLLETLRLYPPAYGFGREATRDLRLGDLAVRKGTIVLVSQWVSHRRPGHFEAPDEFRPERWIDRPPEKLPAGVYFPFGLGPRRCLGEAFARRVVLLVLASIAQKVRLERATSEEVRPRVRLSPRPDGPVRMIVRAALTDRRR